MPYRSEYTGVEDLAKASKKYTEHHCKGGDVPVPYSIWAMEEVPVCYRRELYACNRAVEKTFEVEPKITTTTTIPIPLVKLQYIKIGIQPIIKYL
jgi:hypothetical protein